jgi:hypothetical protein
MKDDAIAQLSDQLLAISTRLQQLERRQATISVRHSSLLFMMGSAVDIVSLLL